MLKRIALGVLPVLALAGCAPYYDGAKSAHFDGAHFFNPAPTPERGLADFLRWRFTREPGEWPDAIANPPSAKPPARVSGDGMLVTMVGHATVLIQTAGLNILTDPIWSERASPLSFMGPKRRRAPGIAFSDLPKIDAVLVSHNHYDHLDLPTLAMLWGRDRPRIVVPLGNDTILKDNIAGVEATAVDWTESVDLGGGVRIVATPVQHWSQRGPFDRDKALWAGYVIAAPGGAIFFSGDTGLGTGWWVDEVKALSPKPIRLALLPIGAYLPRWFMAGAHINADEAIEISRRLGAEAALGIHWGTFPIADDGPDQALGELAAVRAARGISPVTFGALEPGQSWTLK